MKEISRNEYIKIGEIDNEQIIISKTEFESFGS